MTIRFVQLSDTHLFGKRGARLCGLDTAASLAQVLKSAQADIRRADFVLATGDLSQDTLVPSYRRFKTMVSRLGRSVYCLPGNHDHSGRMSGALRGRDVSVVRQIVMGRWHIILLDSAKPRSPVGTLRASELRHLKLALAANPDKHTIVALHHNVVPIDCPWMDGMTVTNADRFFKTIAPHKNVRAVVFGHVHQEFRAAWRGIPLFGCPSTSIQFKPKTKYFELDSLAPGYRWFELFPNGKIKTGVRRAKNYRLSPDFAATGYK